MAKSDCSPPNAILSGGFIASVIELVVEVSVDKVFLFPL